MRNSTSYEAGMLRPRWPIFLITRYERPYKGWWGSRTWTTSGNDSSDSLLGTFLNPLAGRHGLDTHACASNPAAESACVGDKIFAASRREAWQTRANE